MVAVPIGIADPKGRFVPIMDRNVPLPHQATVTITIRAKQKRLLVIVFQGEQEKAKDNEYLGTLTLDPLPETKRPMACQVHFLLNNEGLLTMRTCIPEHHIDETMQLTTVQSAEELLVEQRRDQWINVDICPLPSKHGSTRSSIVDFVSLGR